MGWYQTYVLPKLIDTACSQPPMQELRARYVPRAVGDVLEIGIGSGLNLQHYSRSVNRITGLDPAAELTAVAERRAGRIEAPVSLIRIYDLTHQNQLCRPGPAHQSGKSLRPSRARDDSQIDL